MPGWFSVALLHPGLTGIDVGDVEQLWRHLLAISHTTDVMEDECNAICWCIAGVKRADRAQQGVMKSYGE